MIMNENSFSEKYYMAAMGIAEGVGHKTISALVKFFGSAKVAWFAKTADLLKAGIKNKPLQAFIEFRENFPFAPENLANHCERGKINLCSIFDKDYPPLLKEIDSPPMFFYYRGKLESLAQRIAIVGSRQCSRCGADDALEFGEQIAAAGFTVVSGAARGIDTFAHRGALKSGRTVAVLGCGIEIAFRSDKRKFFEEIIERGVVLSEFPPQLPPTSGTFAARNRIIAGLSKGVIVVEAELKSGTMITANYATKYGRDVFAVSKSNYADNSFGVNKLLCGGAISVKNAFDVYSKYRIMELGEKK